MTEEVLADSEAAAVRGAELITEAADAAIGERGSFSLAVSGGHAPWRMFELLGERELDWRRVTILQVDERVAPDGDADRNLTRLRDSLPAEALERLRPMPVTDPDPEAAAARYAAELPERIDLVHLGLGPDGHTASLVPGDPVLDVRDRQVAVTGEYHGRRRMTLTYPVLEAARTVLWLVTGADKPEALAKLRAGDKSIPAGRLRAANAILLADREAAA
ncbi:MAG TPA: 6-phosphogluconolactonase [Solirubrobacterales bacterium]|nr:6-phosphogluconolactonase [Solirubrobacterales bacterium]